MSDDRLSLEKTDSPGTESPEASTAAKVIDTLGDERI